MELLTIGQMAERNCVTKKTLRLYHEKGLLVPEHVDEENGRRYYTSGQSYQLDLIQPILLLGLLPKVTYNISIIASTKEG